MVVLKKIKAATLMETLVATVLIVVVFVMASTILNNVFSNQIKNNRHQLNNYIYELEYLYQSDKISLPYQTEFKDWIISLSDNNEPSSIVISAKQKETQKELTRVVNAH